MESIKHKLRLLIKDITKFFEKIASLH